MKTILVTGVNGFVGHHLAAELVAQDFEVIGLGGNNVAGHPANLKHFVTADLSSRAEVDTIDFKGIDGVINLAGLAAVGPSFDAPMEYINTNAGIQINLFEAAIAQNVHPRFVTVSSGSLYSTAAKLPLTELSDSSPTSPYAISKLTQEFASLYYANRGLETIIARPFNHFGPGQNPGFIAPDLAQQVISVERGEADEILVGNLDAKRDYTDVRDIVRAYIALLMNGVSGEIYNICSGTAKSGHQMLNSMVDYAGITPLIKQDPARMRPADNPIIYGDHTKITNHTGWSPAISFETTIGDVIEDWRAR